jgi:hypothetical protein
MPRSKSHKKKRQPKRVLALPALEHAKAAVLNSLTSVSGQRTYDHAIREFAIWYCSEPRPPSTVQWFSATGFISTSGSTHPRRSTYDWRRSVASRTKPPTPDS